MVWSVMVLSSWGSLFCSLGLPPTPASNKAASQSCLWPVCKNIHAVVCVHLCMPLLWLWTQFEYLLAQVATWLSKWLFVCANSWYVCRNTVNEYTTIGKHLYAHFYPLTLGPCFWKSGPKHWNVHLVYRKFLPVDSLCICKATADYICEEQYVLF